MTSKNNMEDMNMMLIKLKEVWGFVDLMPCLNYWLCHNATDEGLGGDDDKKFYGNTPLDAVQKAYKTII